MSVIQSDKIDEFLGDLDYDQAMTLVNLVAGLDPTGMVSDGENGFKPLFSADEMNIIGQFKDFVADSSEEEEDEDDDLIEEDEDGFEKEQEDDGDIPGTGEEDEPVASNAEPTA